MKKLMPLHLKKSNRNQRYTCGNKSHIDAFPLIPYEYFTDKHIAFDLIYNPAETQFLKGKRERCTN
jgi:shikimate 5-dehydrogenase